ncbi:MAG: hypoxanthine phosphoribosyltransferase [Bacteriovoracales bacterium]|nr:hypoxanthine phosphoribosyltransferase [Bacteriovoracales bacterium]
MNKSLPRVLISREQIAHRVDKLGRQITADFQGEEIVILCILNGAFVFCSDLIKKIQLPLKVEFISLSSYGSGTDSKEEVICEWDCKLSLRDRNVVIVEDIVDSGLTIKYLLQMIHSRGAKSVKVAALLFKPSRNRYPVSIDYLGFEIPDQFVVGHGLDHAQKYRELPYIGIIE